MTACLADVVTNLSEPSFLDKLPPIMGYPILRGLRSSALANAGQVAHKVTIISIISILFLVFNLERDSICSGGQKHLMKHSGKRGHSHHHLSEVSHNLQNAAFFRATISAFPCLPLRRSPSWSRPKDQGASVLKIRQIFCHPEAPPGLPIRGQGLVFNN